MPLIRNRGWRLALLWSVLILAVGVALRRAPLFTGTDPSGSGLEAVLGAPILALLPLLGVILLSAWLTIQWWRERPRAAERTPPTA